MTWNPASYYTNPYGYGYGYPYGGYGYGYPYGGYGGYPYDYYGYMQNMYRIDRQQKVSRLLKIKANQLLAYESNQPLFLIYSAINENFCSFRNYYCELL